MERFNLETSYLVGVFIITSICHRLQITPKVGVVRSRDLNLKFGTPSITLEWIKICTPNFVG